MKVRMRSVRLTAFLVAMAAGAATTLADLPAVMDKVPADASMVVAFRNVGAFLQRVDELATVLGTPMDNMEGDHPLQEARRMLAIPGIRSDGAMAMIALPDAQGNFVEDHGVVLVPTTDFDAMAKGLNAEKAGDVWTAEVEGEPLFIKAGQGYAILGKDQALVTSFQMATGSAMRFETALGAVGKRIGDTADMIVILNAATMRPMMEEAIGGMGEGFDQMAEAGIPNAEALTAGVGAMQGALSAMARDASTAIVGVSIGSRGLTIDLGGQFAEGSATAASLGGMTDSGVLMGRLPKVDFYFAGAIDTASPMMQAALKAMGSKDDQSTMKVLGDNADKIGGMSFVVGASPAGLMGGLLANTAMYTASTNAQGYADAYYGAMKSMDGKTVEGMTYKFTHTPGAAEVSGSKVDTWQLGIQPDPNDPESMQVMMMQQMLFGPGGMQGMTAVTKSGMVATMSQNTMLMTQALSAAASGEGLSTAADLRTTQAAMPAKRVMEMYLGTRSILEAVNGAMAMWMGGAEEINISADVAPIGIAMSAEKGGGGLHLHVPMSSAKAIGEFAKAMQGQFGDMEGDAADPMMDDAPPRF